MLKRTFLLFTVFCTAVVLFTTTVISSDKSNKQMITSEELQQISDLRIKLSQSNLIEQNTLAKIPSMIDVNLNASGLKQFRESLSVKNKLMEQIQLQNIAQQVRAIRLESLGNADRDCSDCEFDFTAYGSECCDSAWDEYGISCTDLEANYSWDCSGCACPGDTPGECGDGACNINEDCESCEADCGVCGECADGEVLDCDGSNECWPESWIGDGFTDCNDQQYGADLTCYDCDGGDCPESDPGCGETTGGGDVYGCTDPSACNYDADATMDDGSCEELDDCGECGGDGMTVVCSDGSIVCDPADCPAEDPDVLIIAEHATASNGMAEVTLSYHSTVDIAGIQFTLSDEPESAVAVDFTTDNSDFTASHNDSGGDVTTVYFSLTGAVLPTSCDAAHCEDVVFATLSYELTSELSSDDVIDLHFTEVVCANAAGAEVASGGVDGSISSGGGMTGDVNGDNFVNVQDIILIVNMILDGADYSAIADVNGDGAINVQDIILIVNMILDSRAIDATRAEILRTPGQLLLKSDGFIGAVQMTLNHGANFSIDLTDHAMVADYRTSGNQTKVIVVVPATDELFSHSGDFDIVEMMVVNGSDEIPVVTPAVFTLSDAYPNPFNPSTSITLEVADAGYVSIKVYNLMGQIASTLSEGYMHPGNYTLNWDASNQVSGMYLVKAETAGYITTKKLLLIK